MKPGGVICPSLALNGLSGTSSPTAGTENWSPVSGAGLGAGTGIAVAAGVGVGVGDAVMTGSCSTVFPSIVCAADALCAELSDELWNEAIPVIPATVRHAAEAAPNNTTGMVGRLPHHPFGLIKRNEPRSLRALALTTI